MKIVQKRRIWIITELFYPEEDATAFIFTKIANYFSTDFDVNVICGPDSYDGSNKKITTESKLNANISLFRSNSIKLNKNNLYQRTLRFFLLSFQLANTLRKNAKKGDTVLIATNPAPLLILISILKHFKTFNLQILVHDVFPENTIVAGIFKSKNNILFKLLKYIFDHGYNKADHVIVLGKDMKELLERKANKTSISIVPNWADIENITPILRSDSLIKKWGLEKKLVLQYAGNIGRVQGLQEVIKAFHQSNNQNIHLSIFGSGAYESNIKQYVQENEINNISFHGNYSRKEQQNVLNACDIAIISLSKGMYGLGVPSKTYNILAAGKPVLFIGEPGSEIFELVRNEQIGWSIDISNELEIINFFSNLNKNDIENLSSKRSLARRLSEEKYSEETVLSNLKNSINKFIK